MWVFCALGSAVFDKIGVKWALVVGCSASCPSSCLWSRTAAADRLFLASVPFSAVGYVPYSLGLYFNKTQGIEWVVLFGAALCGISAGIFWATEGALILGYPEARKRGVALAIWLAFKSGGQVLGGAINVGLFVADAFAFAAGVLTLWPLIFSRSASTSRPRALAASRRRRTLSSSPFSASPRLARSCCPLYVSASRLRTLRTMLATDAVSLSTAREGPARRRHQGRRRHVQDWLLA
jgi:hypothetical protein